MTATTADIGIAPANRAGVKPLSFGRSCLVELRKLHDTRPGVALLATGAVLSLGFAAGRAWSPLPETDYGALVAMACGPAGTLLMVLAVLLVSSEFTAGTASVTFVLDPNRRRVIAAKTAVVLGMALLVTLLACAAAALVVLGAPATTGRPLPWTANWTHVAVVTGANVFLALAGLAWGLLTRGVAAPLIVLLTWPTLAHLLATVSPTGGAVLGYVDLAPTYRFLTDPGAAPGMIAASTTCWLILPGLLGVRRLVRGDLS